MTPPPETHAPEELLAHDGWVRALARRLVRDEVEAEDLVQETWLAALRSPPRRDRSPRPWLARVLRNSLYARGQRRRDRAWHEREREVREPAERAPEDLLQRVEAQQLVTEELLALPEPFRTTVLERYWNGHSSAELARRDGVAPGTVRWRLKHGLDLLRARLDARLGDRASWCALLLPLTAPTGVVRGGGAAAILTTLGGPAVLGLGGALGALLLGVLAALGLGPLAGGPDDAALASLAPPAATPTPDDAPTLHAGPSAARERARPDRPVPTGGDPDTPTSGTTERAPSAPADLASSAPATHAEGAIARVRARIVDGRGEPVAGARLTLRHAGLDRTVEVGADGYVELALDDAADARLVQVVASAPAHRCALERLRPRAGATHDLGTLVLGEGCVLAGVVHGPDGAPLGDVEVLASARVPAGGALPERPACSRLVRTDDTGRFELPCAPTGDLWLHARHASRGAERLRLTDLHAGERRADLVLALRPPAPRVTGTLLDGDGEPVPGARLAWREVNDEGRGEAHRVPAADLDATGRFALTERHGLPAGEEVELLAWDAEGARVALARVAADGGAVRLDLRPATPTRVELPADAEDTTLVARCLWGDLELFRSEGPAPLALPCPPGDHRLEVEAADRGAATLDRRTPVARWVAHLETPGLLRGTLTDRSGGLAAGARVALYRVDDGPDASLHGLPLDRAAHPADLGVVDPRGRFALELAERGRYVLRAEAPGEVPLELGPLDLDPDRPGTPLALAFGAGGRVVGQLAPRAATWGDPATAGGPAAVGAPVRAAEAGRWVLATRLDHLPRCVRVDDAGAFELADLTPGTWWLLEATRPVPERSTSITEHGAGFGPALELDPARCAVVEVTAGGEAFVTVPARAE